MNKTNLVVGGILIILLVGFFLVSNKSVQTGIEGVNEGEIIVDGIQAKMYKSPSCGCCTGHAAELERRGYDVEIVESSNMNQIKSEHHIPGHLQSCHTVIIGDYFFEGHIPIDVINEFLEEQPDVDGLTLPGMPLGTPGMPGKKIAPYRIFSITDGVGTLYKTV